MRFNKALFVLSIVLLVVPAIMVMPSCTATDSDCGCSAGQTPVATAPDDWGSFGVGVAEYNFADDERARELPTLIYYPARETPPEEGDYGNTLNIVSINAVADALPDASGAPYPVIVFSHGSGMQKEGYKYLLEYLASHGFVCVIFDHTGNVGMDNFLPDDLSFSVTRYYDVSFIIDRTIALFDEEQDRLVGMGDRERIGVAGHSWGGNTVLGVIGVQHSYDYFAAECVDEAAFDIYVCPLTDVAQQIDADFPDERIKAAVTLAFDGGQTYFGPDCVGAAAATVPLLIAGGTVDILAPFDREMVPCFENYGGEVYLLKLIAAGHAAFADLVNEASMDTERQHSLTARYITAFFGYYLKNEEYYEPYLQPEQAQIWNEGYDDFELSNGGPATSE